MSSTMKPSEVEQVRSLIEAISYRFKAKAERKGVDIRDLKQAAWERAVRDCRTWNPEIGSLSTILWAPLHQAMSRELQKLSSPASHMMGDRDHGIDPDELPLDKAPLSTIQSRELLAMILSATQGSLHFAEIYSAFMVKEIFEEDAASRTGMTRREWQSFVRKTTEAIRRMSKQVRDQGAGWLDFGRAQRIFKIGRNSLYRWKKDGSIETKMIGGCCYVKSESLREKIGHESYDALLKEYQNAE